MSIAAIARKVGVSRNTVYKYLEMSLEEIQEWLDTLKTRRKRLDPFKDHILTWLREHPDLSASQIQDWLDEKFSLKNIGESTVRGYVHELREFYHIPKTLKIRSYESVEELPMGKQMQVDFGEIIVKNANNKEVKLYVIVFVLSHSRFKYAEWQDQAFTTQDVIRAHENAFQYYGGMTEEIVYDQDHLITVSENAGDIIYTSEFQVYKQNRGFRVYLCRKSDPESKGKVENAVKFVKGNFAKHRPFHDIESWNEQCLAWLERKGNYQVHNTTKKRPTEVYALEKQHLQKVSYTLSIESNHNSSITRTVHKDNIVKFKSNRYSVPLGTYRPRGDNTVYLEMEDKKLIIKSTPNGDILASHDLCEEKGKLIKNRNHTRDRSKGIQAYTETVQRQFSKQDEIVLFLSHIRENYPRYLRDQLQKIQQAVHAFRPYVDEALQMCIQQHLWSANDFYDIARYLADKKPKEVSSDIVDTPTTLHKETEALLKEQAIMRPMEDYIKILEGN